ncbi:MAG: glycosyltransferase family 4 protein [Cyclobacteriaceae bacterium]|nr:glycosyltransferase family 4 protein [Cyclobacteriaceae bacterium]
MNIVLFHQHFHTPQQGGALRSYYLANALAESGFAVTVITSHNNKEIKTENGKGFTIIYLPVPYKNEFSFFKRLQAYLQFTLKAIAYARTLPKANGHYVMSTPLTSGLIGLYFKIFNKTPYLFETGDLWPDAPIQLGVIKNPVLKWMLYRLEKCIYQHATALVSLSPTMQTMLQRKAKDKTIFLLPNITDINVFKQAAAHPPAAFSQQNPFIISYTGALGFANGLHYLVDVARLCAKENLPIQFLIAGKGAMLGTLQETITNLQVKNVHLLPATNREGVVTILKKAHAVYISYRQVPILETGSPNKYPDALAAEKLVITNFKGWIAKEIAENQCGFTYSVEKPETFLEKIKPYLQNTYLIQEAQQKAGSIAKRYSAETEGKRFANFFSVFNK